MVNKKKKNEIKIDQQLESYPRRIDRRDIGLFVSSIGGLRFRRMHDIRQSRDQHLVRSIIGIFVSRIV